MAHFSFRLLTLAGLVAALGASGCVYRNGVSTCRFWADYNTLLAPALFIEETDHLPYHEARIEHYHWMYNARTVAQRHQGALYPAAAVDSHRIEQPDVTEPAVPAPSDLPPEEPETPDNQVPPLPSKLPQQLKMFDDGPAPANPIPASPKPQPPEIDGPTASKPSPRSSRRN